MCYIGLDRLADAEDAFCHVLHADVTWRPDPDLMTSDEIGMFYQAAPKCGVDLEPPAGPMMVPDKAGDIGIRPYAGLGVQDGVGITFGAALPIALSQRLMAGPFAQFSTVGWKIDQTNPTDRTAASNAIAFGGRADLVVGPRESGIYIFAGASATRFGTITKYEGGESILVFDSQGNESPLDLKARIRPTLHVGLGKIQPLRPRMPLTFEVGAAFGSGTGVVGKTDFADDIEIQNANRDSFWRIDVTTGLHFSL